MGEWSDYDADQLAFADSQGIDPGDAMGLPDLPSAGGGGDTFHLGSLASAGGAALAGFSIGGPNGIVAGGDNLGVIPMPAPPAFGVQARGGGRGRGRVGKAIMALVKAVGLSDTTARALGLTLQQLAMFVSGQLAKKGTRRRRGITGRQLATAKRVNRTIFRMAEELQRSVPHRRSGGSHAAAPKHRKK